MTREELMALIATFTPDELKTLGLTVPEAAKPVEGESIGDQVTKALSQFLTRPVETPPTPEPVKPATPPAPAGITEDTINKMLVEAVGVLDKKYNSELSSLKAENAKFQVLADYPNLPDNYKNMVTGSTREEIKASADVLQGIFDSTAEAARKAQLKALGLPEDQEIDATKLAAFLASQNADEVEEEEEEEITPEAALSLLPDGRAKDTISAYFSDLSGIKNQLKAQNDARVKGNINNLGSITDQNPNDSIKGVKSKPKAKKQEAAPEKVDLSTLDARASELFAGVFKE